ncbi:MAG: ROK family protein [Opitutaceae bacterium]|nr:ROK family protein [Opitutaceae bacterium]
MNSSRLILGVDLGGTHVKGIVVDSSGRICGEDTRRTADGADDGWQGNVRALVAALRQRFPEITAAGLCAPGLAARDERSIVNMPGRLRGLAGLVWSDELELPTVVLNDAHAALLGEVWQGAASGGANVLMITLGTGVGGAAMVDGRLLRGHLGRAGHVGHVSLNPEGTPDIVGTPGSLEDAIGDCTVAERSGGRFQSTRDLVAAAVAGDSEAGQTWARSVRALGAALASLINVLDPQTIVLGGGIAAAGDVLFKPLAASLARMEWRVGSSRVAVVPARLGAQAGAFGAAYRALQNLSKS